MHKSTEFESALSDLIENAVGIGIERASAQARPEPLPESKPGFRWISNLKTQEETGWSRAKLQRLRASRELRYTKVGASIFYLRADIDALLERNIVLGEGVVR